MLRRGVGFLKAEDAELIKPSFTLRAGKLVGGTLPQHHQII